ncbi:CPBP family intramembrane glutamic endopeptidase [Spiroplasma endosymbiont of Crioceris asparagi]|uniref:CPBP family intramembrane glutamic endopeptidase n=1 Tax=Spiroplasma endosymbiont of Crioceris asparagi TaxID=3066286 RepID=UPI0030D13B0C
MNKFKLAIKKSNEKYNNTFNLTDFRRDGLLFILFVLVIPMISCFLLFAVFNNFKAFSTDQKNISSINIMIQLFSPLIGIYIFYIRQKEIFYKEGFFMFLFYSIMPIVLSICLMMFAAEKSNDSITTSNYKNSAQILGQAIYEFIFILVAFKQIKSIREIFIETFKKSWKLILITTFFGVLLTLFSTFIVNLIHSSQSVNQESLTRGLKSAASPSKTLLIISLFLFTVLVAPLFEEIICRHLINMFVSNQTWGFIFSALFFAAIHIMQSGDFENILSYLAPAIVLTAFFSLSGGNIAYSWPIHSIYNMVVLIIEITNPGGTK